MKHLKVGIYTIINKSDNKIYVGFSSNIESRFEKHINELKRNSHINNHLQSSWNKYSSESFHFEILEECEIDFLYSQEHYWATLLNVHDRKFGYNLQPTNPNGTWGVSKETRDKISSSNKGKTVSQETRDKISKTLMGHEGHFNNKKHTEEAKLKISLANTGNVHSKESREKMSNYHKGKILSEETKEKIRIGNQGKGMSIENRKIVSERQSKPILQYDLDDNFIKEWKSVTEAINYFKGDIPAVLKGRQNQSCGFKWKYKNE